VPGSGKTSIETFRKMPPVQQSLTAKEMQHGMPWVYGEYKHVHTAALAGVHFFMRLKGVA